MRLLFTVLKGYIAFVTCIFIYLASHFSLGNNEDWDFMVRNYFWEFFFSRLLFTVLVGLIFFLLSLLLNRIFRKIVSYKKKYVLFEFILIVFISVLFVLKSFYWYN